MNIYKQVKFKSLRHSQAYSADVQGSKILDLPTFTIILDEYLVEV